MNTLTPKEIVSLLDQLMDARKQAKTEYEALGLFDLYRMSYFRQWLAILIAQHPEEQEHLQQLIKQEYDVVAVDKTLQD